MKKRIFISIFALCLLTACGIKSNNEASPVQSEEETIETDDSVKFLSEEDFFASSSFTMYSAKSEKEEKMMLKPLWDESKYDFVQILSCPSCYYYTLSDKETKDYVDICISTTSYENISDYASSFEDSDHTITTLESNGKTYDVWRHTSPYSSKENYSVTFIPYEGYTAGISIPKQNVTAEEITSVFWDFEFVLVE